MQKETVLWKKGLLIIPDIVHQLLYSMQVLKQWQQAHSPCTRSFLWMICTGMGVAIVLMCLFITNGGPCGSENVHGS